jgi:hypothetical protein
VRRTLVALSLALAVAAVARTACADDFKWDPKVKKAPPVPGYKEVADATEYHKVNVKVTQGEQVVQNVKDEATTTYKFTREIVKVDDKKKVTESVFKIEKWKIDKKGEDPDTSLEGHTVRVTGTGEAKTFKVEDDKDDKVSDGAKQWIENELAKKKKGGDDDEEDEHMKALFPSEPVGDGAEWKPDLAAVTKALGTTDYDPEKSSAKGSLTKVRVENGVHVGHIEIQVSLAVKQPGVTWKEGGVMEMTISLDSSLELDKRDAQDGTVEVKFSGKGDAEGPQGPMTFKQTVNEKRTMKAEPLAK